VERIANGALKRSSDLRRAFDYLSSIVQPLSKRGTAHQSAKRLFLWSKLGRALSLSVNCFSSNMARPSGSTGTLPGRGSSAASASITRLLDAHTAGYRQLCQPLLELAELAQFAEGVSRDHREAVLRTASQRGATKPAAPDAAPSINRNS
jgi:hypothetical protein